MYCLVIQLCIIPGLNNAMSTPVCIKREAVALMENPKYLKLSLSQMIDQDL